MNLCEVYSLIDGSQDFVMEERNVGAIVVSSLLARQLFLSQFTVII